MLLLPLTLTEKGMKRLSNREFQSSQLSVQQLKEKFEQGRESPNGMGKVQTDLINSRCAPDRERVVRSRDQRFQFRKKVLLLELQRIFRKEAGAELQQLRDLYQLCQNEPQNKLISRQNHNWEMEDKQAQEQQRQLEEERSRGTGLEEELRQLRLQLAAERQEVQSDRNRLQEECNSMARELESYSHRLRESERIASEYEQLLSEETQLKSEVEAQLEEQRRLLEEERLRRTGLEEELRQLLPNLVEETESRLQALDEIQELRSELTAAQQSLNEYRRLEPRDWIIRRDEVTITGKTLGGGAWGNVVEGRFRGCEVAVKRIHELILSQQNRRLFAREMSIASRCRHPCLLQFIGATNVDGTPLFVTELLDTDLRSVLLQRSLPNEEITTIGRDIAKALNYLHLNRPSPIIHRDISSANVLLWKRNNCWRGKLSDYGAANFMRQSMTAMPGASIYAAPEAMTSQQSPKIDVYSFGLLLCEMCTRELPVPQQTQEQIRLVTNGVLRELVMRCVQTDPESRPSIAEVITDLDRCTEQ